MMLQHLLLEKEIRITKADEFISEWNMIITMTGLVLIPTVEMAVTHKL